jgi:signal transduction histidine kinase
MSLAESRFTARERQLGAIIGAYNEVTEKLKRSHEELVREVGRLRDQLEEKNRELARRDRMAALGEMAAGVAHEIRNPLAGIQLYTSLLMKDLPAGTQPRDLAQRIAAAVEVLEGIVTDILAFAGPSPPQAQRVALGAVVRDCLELVKPSVSARSVKIIVDQRVHRTHVYVDPRQLQRALLNLLYNALEVVERQGCVQLMVGSSDEDGFCTIEVADDGPGVPPDLLNRVFDPFFTTRDSGTGLGLAIVHSFAEAHGGRVWVRNREEGGASFTLLLPVDESENG